VLLHREQAINPTDMISILFSDVRAKTWTRLGGMLGSIPGGGLAGIGRTSRAKLGFTSVTNDGSRLDEGAASTVDLMSDRRCPR
jgi:hypothetical protein